MGGRDDVPGLSEVLRKARMEAGLSQQQAGERSGVHHISIAKFETGKKTPTIASLYKLAEAYGVNVCDLLPGGVMPADEPEPAPPLPPAPTRTGTMTPMRKPGSAPPASEPGKRAKGKKKK